MNRRGFTLLEMLIVVFILMILIGFLSSSVLKAMREANKKLAENQQKTLQAAIWSYRHEYERWPGSGTNLSGTIVYTDDNHIVVEEMTNSDTNVKGVQFLTFSDYTLDESNNIVHLITKQPYVVELKLDSDDVSVYARQ